MSLPRSQLQLRWSVDSSRWGPSPDEWSFLLRLVPEARLAEQPLAAHPPPPACVRGEGARTCQPALNSTGAPSPQDDAAKVMKFVHEEDRKRALLSQLLQRAACHRALGVPFADARILRTKGGKPFLARQPPRAAARPSAMPSRRPLPSLTPDHRGQAP